MRQFICFRKFEDYDVFGSVFFIKLKLYLTDNMDNKCLPISCFVSIVAFETNLHVIFIAKFKRTE